MARAKSLRAVSDWGTPDPRTADAYPKPPATSPAQWAWEFLRRRANYRARWRELVEPLVKYDGRWDFEAEDRQRQAKGILYISPLVSFGAKFKISPSFGNFFLDPRLSRPPVFDPPGVIEIRGPVSSTARFAPPVIAFRFDVQSSADPQFAYAKARFIKEQKKWLISQGIEIDELRHQLGIFPRYLRLLDFKELRTRNKEIGTYLFPQKSGDELRDMISKNRKAAGRCQDNYLAIAFGSSTEQA